MSDRTSERLASRVVAELWGSPTRVVVLSFAAVALLGALLLMLPISLAGEAELSFLNALFTAVSAVCVTGLIVVDTATHFTAFGQAVILVLIQLGGLGIMVFSVATVWLVRKRFSVGEAELLSYVLNDRNRAELGGRLVGILRMTLIVEVSGALFLSLRFLFAYGEPVGRAVWLGLFHAVSAFCNAGFALFTTSLEQFSDDITINLTVMVLIVIGGLGFAANRYIGRSFGARVTNSPRYVQKGAGINVRVAVAGALILTLVGFLGVYLFEGQRSLAEQPIGEKYLISLFQSVTLRTAGFNTAGIGAFSRTLLLFMVPIMLIGGATGGTAGGVKTGTVAVLFSDVRRFVLGRSEAVLFGRRIPGYLITQATTLLVTAMSVFALAVLLLSAVESAPLEELVFEAASALGTVGLSTGITGSLSAMGRIVIMVLMFAGRLGPLTLLATLRPGRSRVVLEYVDVDISIG